MEKCDNCGFVPFQIIAYNKKGGCNEVSYRCKCKAVTVLFTRDEGGLEKAQDLGYEEWKKKNPDSESEAGVDADKVWDATLDAMMWAYRWGRGAEKIGYDSVATKEQMAKSLRSFLHKFIDTDRRDLP